ncbi:MAG: peptidylprolyl isomerase [Proteobacteria bacterium]|nr:peptidylprolyl isomerase [Pseudomonadota bacterium]
MTNPNSAGAPALASALPRLAGLIIGALALTVASTAPLMAQDAKDPVVATVNGTPIHQSDLAVAEEEAGQLPPMSEDAKKDYLVQFMADAILITKAAEDKKLNNDEAFKRKLEFARKKLLMEALLAQIAKDASTDAAMHKVYDDAVAKLPAEEEVKASHILIRVPAGDDKANAAAEDKIKAVIARLNKGEDFAKVADEVTEDPSGKGKGGDLGYFTKDQMVPEFANVAFSLDKGKISGPVKTQFGWHVIKVTDKREKPKPTFEQVKPQVEQFVARKAQADFVTKLRADAKIVKNYKVEEPKADDKATPATPKQ